MIVKEYKDGYVICADSTLKSTKDYVMTLVDQVHLIVTDPPYGNIVKDSWDKTKLSDDDFANWMVDWTRLWSDLLIDKSAFCVWGGIGRQCFRPFLKYISMIEIQGQFELANLLTWKKKRAYGLSYNYLFVREECAYFVKGAHNKPRVFNIPLLNTKRGYAGYNKKYPAKSEFLRRTNVWDDISEIFKGKTHPTQKTQKLYEVLIETHSNQGEWVLDMFGGSGVCAHAAMKTGRKFIVIEKDKQLFDDIVKSLDAANST